MGSPRNIRESHTLAMKILYLVGSALAALAVADAEPEADANADAWYGYGYGYGLGHDMVDIMTMVPTDLTMADTGEGRRGKLRQSQQLLLIPMLMQMLMLGIVPMDMALDTMAGITDLTMVTDIEDTDTGARRRGLLMLNQ